MAGLAALGIGVSTYIKESNKISLSGQIDSLNTSFYFRNESKDCNPQCETNTSEIKLILFSH